MKKSTQDLLEERRSVWKSKEVIRRLYLKWYGLIKECLRPGKTLELGGGSGNLSEFLPEAITSDIVFEPWLDAVMDAHFLPFKDDSLENIVLFDVLHHLAAPAIFFCEAERVLRPEGRMVVIEPYVSLLSRPVYRFLHSEGMKWNVDPLQGDPSGAKEPFQGNQAVPTLLFERHRGRLLEKVPRLKIVREAKMDTLIYPLSGGFHNPSLCPMFLYPALERFERWSQPIEKYMAFRMLVALEKG